MVNDIDAASKYFKDTLGFRMRGSARAGNFDGTLVAPITFPDNTAIELLSVEDSVEDGTIPEFISNFLASVQGVHHYSLASSSADSTANWLTKKGFLLDTIASYRTTEVRDGWSRDDGTMKRKSLDFNANNPPPHLPRFIERTDYNYKQAYDQWRTYYGFNRRYNEHPNGVVGMSAICIVVQDLAAISGEFQKMGFEQLEVNDAMARYKIYRNQELQLMSAGDDEKLNAFLAQRGEGVYALRFEVINLDSTYQYLENELPGEALNKSSERIIIPQEYAYGVQLEFVQESEEQGLLASTLRPDDELDSSSIKHAENLYSTYCALCHGADREGYAADNAPSLRSKSLLATSENNNFMRYTIQYGRANTAMAGYLDRRGGPMEYIDIEILLEWLYQTAEVEDGIDLSREPVHGDIALGATIYADNCAVCHGAEGEGVSAPALGNPMLLATATDHFLRYAIAEGRDGTPMLAFKETLDSTEIDAVTAFLRTRASGWDIPEPDTVTIPSPENYVLNPDNAAPNFNLREDKYVSAVQVNQAMQDSLRMIILDARSEVAWRQMHIPGSLPVPYYEDPENFIDDIPNDSTQIVIYCACPHAASQRVMNTLKRHGYENTAILDEGILVWAQMGFPVRNGN